MHARRNEIFAVAGLVTLGFAVRLAFLLLYENMFSWEAEDYSKINLVYDWIAADKPYPDPNFGPLHTWIIYVLAFPFGDKVLPVRVFSLACGVAALPVFWSIARREMKSGPALAALAFFCVYPVHVRASATSLAEAPYALAFFGGLALWYSARAGERRAVAKLAGAAAAFTAAGMLRFEAWLFFPVLCLALIPRGFARAALFGAMLALFPLWHMDVCWATRGDPFAFGATSAASFELYLPQMDISYRATAWPQAFWHALSPPLFVACAVGLGWAAAVRRGGMLLALFLVPYLLLSYRTLNGQLDPALLRYSVVIAALLIPFAGGACADIPARLFSQRKHLGAAIAVALVASIASFEGYWAVVQAEENRLPDDIRQVARFLREARPDDRIILDKRFHPYLVVESRRDPSTFRTLLYDPGGIKEWEEYRAVVPRLFPLAYLSPDAAVTWGRDIKRYNSEEFARTMREFDPTLIVIDYESGGNLQAFRLGPTVTETVEYGRRFTRVLRTGDFAIFRVERIEGEDDGLGEIAAPERAEDDAPEPPGDAGGAP
ncbi:glycosyltransferase family 39 protein [bacterium]|nr:glycosyltransferase family 39 protein [bacterium]